LNSVKQGQKIIIEDRQRSITSPPPPFVLELTTSACHSAGKQHPISLVKSLPKPLKLSLNLFMTFSWMCMLS